MKGKHKENSSYKIKVNKTLIHKKSICNLKNLGTPNKISNGIKNNSNDIIQRNSFSRKIKNMSTIDFDSNENLSNKNYYSQKTYTCKYLLEYNTYNEIWSVISMKILCSRNVQGISSFLIFKTLSSYLETRYL